MKNYFKIGKLVATHGLGGELLLQHSLGKKTSLKNLEAIFIEEKNGSFLPYFIQSSNIKSEKEVYIKIEGIETKETAHKLLRNHIWLVEEDFKKFASASAPISLLGFIIMSNEEELGEILEVIEQPHQILCRIIYKNKEAMIPVHDDSLEKIDKKNKKVYVDLPDGLLEIYS